jgi:hypothetical protein
VNPESKIAQLINQKSTVNNPHDNTDLVSKVAGTQLGAQQYRKKAKKRINDGLKPNYLFENSGAEASLNRIMGKEKSRSRAANNLVSLNLSSSK